MIRESGKHFCGTKNQIAVEMASLLKYEQLSIAQLYL